MATTELRAPKEPGDRGTRLHRYLTARAAAVVAAIGCGVLLVVFVVIPLAPSRFQVVNATTHASEGDRTVTERMLVHNSYPEDQRLRAADLSAPGIRLINTNTPLTIASRGTAWVEVTYRVTDCQAAVRAEGLSPFPINLRIAEWFGVHTETVTDHGTLYPGPSNVCP